MFLESSLTTLRFSPATAKNAVLRNIWLRNAAVEPETVSRFERGETLPSLVRLAEMAEVYEVPLEAFVRGTSASPLDQSNEIAAELNGFSRDDRDFVRKWVTEMCAKLTEKVEKAP